MSKQIILYDTTLRDGTQGEQVTLSAEDKLRIAKKLDEYGFPYIEGGWPGSNPKDARFFELAGKTAFNTSRMTAFGSTRRPMQCWKTIWFSRRTRTAKVGLSLMPTISKARHGWVPSEHPNLV